MGNLSTREVWFPAPEHVEIRERRLRQPEADEVGITALASGISHGTEMLVYHGAVPAEMPLDLPTLRGSFNFPISYGYASVGRVQEVGDAVTNLKPGDLVFCHHPHHSAYIVPATLPILLPRHLNPETGIFLANLETAVNVVLDAHPRLGDRVVIFGQGVVGILVTHLLQRAGVSTVVAVEPVAARRKLAAETGAVVVPDATRIRDVLAGPADIAIEISGNPAALQSAISVVGFQGTVVAASWYGSKEVPLDLGSHFHRQRIRIISSQVSHLDPALQPRWTPLRRIELARELLTQVPLQRLISHRFPVQEAAEAYRTIAASPEDVMQVILSYGDSDV